MSIVYVSDLIRYQHWLCLKAYWASLSALFISQSLSGIVISIVYVSEHIGHRYQHCLFLASQAWLLALFMFRCLSGIVISIVYVSDLIRHRYQHCLYLGAYRSSLSALFMSQILTGIVISIVYVHQASLSSFVSSSLEIIISIVFVQLIRHHWWAGVL